MDVTGVGDRKIRVWDGRAMIYLDGSTAFSFDGVGKLYFMPSTGLLDKNGIEIYEGDVVSWRYWYLWDEKNEAFTAKKIVTYEENLSDLDEKVMAYSFRVSPCDLMTVIGNIFESPDLAVGLDSQCD